MCERKIFSINDINMYAQLGAIRKDGESIKTESDSVKTKNLNNNNKNLDM